MRNELLSRVHIFLVLNAVNCATAATARRTPTHTGHRTRLSGGLADTIHTATSDTTKLVCVVSVVTM